MTQSSLISTLRKVRNPVPAQERCDFCGTVIPEEHRHFVDLSEMRFMCACGMCSLVQAESGDFQPLPQRVLLLPDFDLTDQHWDEFMIPVNMAFFVRKGPKMKPVTYYPAPTGATESKLKIDAWDRLAKLNPILKELTPELEGLLINRLDDPPYEYYIVPIDQCYHLIGLIRSEWSGIFGGVGVHETIRSFFARLHQKATAYA